MALLATAFVVLGAAPAVADATSAEVASAVASSRSFAPTVAAAHPQTERAVRPAAVLPRSLRGPSAVDALGGRLPQVAVRNDLSAPRLKHLLSTDASAWLSDRGELYYQEQAPQETTAAGTTTAATAATAYPTSQTFALHSRPGAKRTLLLDFDGATVSGTAWNSGTGAIPNGTWKGWDSDGAPGTFSLSEHAWIQEVWRQVAETYAPFDIDVTTADTGNAAITRSSSTDQTFGTRVVVTTSADPKKAACGTCLGVAWVGTFDDVDSAGTYQPAWVFASAGMNPMIVAQAASHETGHTLGLQHDATATTSYYAGTAAWGPIMGSSMLRAVSQWSRGEYAGANNQQDDLAVMQAHALPLRADDHGGTLATASPLGTSYAADGVISTRLDTDVFALDASCTGATVTGIGAQTALDLSLEALDPLGKRLSFSSPVSGRSYYTSTGMDASVTLPTTSGRVYLRVDGVGNGSASGTGWSDYASLGQYHLQATGCSAATAVSAPSTSATAPTPTPTPTPTPAPSPTPTPTPAPRPVTAPSAPRIGTASSGAWGGAVNAVARWSAPASTGGAPITRYRLLAKRLDSHDHVVRSYYSGYLGAGVRAVAVGVPRGRYVFVVMAWNSAGHSSWSAGSRVVSAR